MTVSTPHLYWHLLIYQQHLDSVAAEREKQGRDGSWLRNYLQKKLGFTDFEFAPVRESAQRLEKTIAEIDASAKSIAQADRALYGNGLLPSGVQPPGWAKLKELNQDRESAIANEIEILNEALGSKNAARFKAFVEGDFSSKVTPRELHPQLRSGTRPICTRPSAGVTSVTTAEETHWASCGHTVPGRKLLFGHALTLFAHGTRQSVRNAGVETTAAIASSTRTSEIDSYASALITDYTLLEEGYRVAVQGDLYDGNNWVDGVMQNSGLPNVKLSLADPICSDHIYTLVATADVCWWQDEGNGAWRGNLLSPRPGAGWQSNEVPAAPHITSITPKEERAWRATPGPSCSREIEPRRSAYVKGLAPSVISGQGVSLSVNGVSRQH